EALVVRAQPRIEPERLDADDLLLFVAHRAGHVHHVDDDRVRLRLDHFLPGAVAAVLADRDDDRTILVVAPGGDRAPERLLERALEVPQRLGTGGVDAGVAVLDVLDPLFAFGLDARELEL